MDKRILQTTGRVKRQQILRDTCVKTEEFTYGRKLSQEELSVKKDDLSRQYIKLHRLEADKKEKIKEFDTPIKETKKESKKTLEAIRTEMEEVTEQVYLIDDQQAGKMGYYNALGHLVHERFLMPEERQIRITADTGTDN